MSLTGCYTTPTNVSLPKHLYTFSCTSDDPRGSTRNLGIAYTQVVGCVEDAMNKFKQIEKLESSK